MSNKQGNVLIIGICIGITIAAIVFMLATLVS
jgi:hypothetical protein